MGGGDSVSSGASQTTRILSSLRSLAHLSVQLRSGTTTLSPRNRIVLTAWRNNSLSHLNDVLNLAASVKLHNLRLFHSDQPFKLIELSKWFLLLWSLQTLRHVLDTSFGLWQLAHVGADRPSIQQIHDFKTCLHVNTAGNANSLVVLLNAGLALKTDVLLVALNEFIPLLLVIAVLLNTHLKITSFLLVNLFENCHTCTCVILHDCGSQQLLHLARWELVLIEWVLELIAELQVRLLARNAVLFDDVRRHALDLHSFLQIALAARETQGWVLETCWLVTSMA